MPSQMTIAIAADHAGINLKQYLIENVKSAKFHDLGPNSTDSVDYPDFAEKACREVQEGKAERAILVCGSGIGMSIAANKMKGIRAAHAETVLTAKLSAEHNKANVLCLGERITPKEQALEMVNAWMAAEFGGARHERRIEKIRKLEEHCD